MPDIQLERPWPRCQAEIINAILDLPDHEQVSEVTVDRNQEGWWVWGMKAVAYYNSYRNLLPEFNPDAPQATHIDKIMMALSWIEGALRDYEKRMQSKYDFEHAQ